MARTRLLGRLTFHKAVTARCNLYSVYVYIYISPCMDTPACMIWLLGDVETQDTQRSLELSQAFGVFVGNLTYFVQCRLSRRFIQRLPDTLDPFCLYITTISVAGTWQRWGFWVVMILDNVRRSGRLVSKVCVSLTPFLKIIYHVDIRQMHRCNESSCLGLLNSVLRSFQRVCYNATGGIYSNDVLFVTFPHLLSTCLPTYHDVCYPVFR